MNKYKADCGFNPDSAKAMVETKIEALTNENGFNVNSNKNFVINVPVGTTSDIEIKEIINMKDGVEYKFTVINADSTKVGIKFPAGFKESKISYNIMDSTDSAVTVSDYTIENGDIIIYTLISMGQMVCVDKKVF